VVLILFVVIDGTVTRVSIHSRSNVYGMWLYSLNTHFCSKKVFQGQNFNTPKLVKGLAGLIAGTSECPASHMEYVYSIDSKWDLSLAGSVLPFKCRQKLRLVLKSVSQQYNVYLSLCSGGRRDHGSAGLVEYEVQNKGFLS